MTQITVGKIDGVAGAPNPIMVAFGKTIPFSCFVRNEVNGLRKMNEVVYSENIDGSKGVPYMPRVFPVGTWALGHPALRSDPLLAPYFIPTDARQMVDEWEIEDRGTPDKPALWYVKKTGRQVPDFGYGLHCSTAHESDGCLHIIDGPTDPVGTKFTHLDEIVHSLIDWLKDPTMGQPPEIQIQAV